MSKVKQHYTNEAEIAVDKIILQVKQNLITKETAAKDILKVDNVNLLDIHADNVDEVIDIELDNSVYKNQAERKSELGII